MSLGPDFESGDAGAAAVPRRRPYRAILFLVAIAGVMGGSWWAYRGNPPQKGPANVPVIHSDGAPVKEAPANPGGMVVPDQDSQLLNRGAARGGGKVEQLLPDPEQVMQRPPPPPQPPGQTAAASDASSAAAPLPPPAPEVPAPPTVPAATPVAPAAVASVAPAAPAAPKPAPVWAGKGWRLQLGAVRSKDAAEQEWQRLKKAQPDLLGGLDVTIAAVELGDKGTYYRIQAGPIADAAQAAQSCATLKSRKVGCVLVKP